MSGSWVPGGPPGGIAPGLHLVATPIGTARDITLRGLDVLAGAEVLMAEDTRTLRHLMEIHGIALDRRPLIACHDHNETEVAARMVAALEAGKSVAYASEAGTPLVSDPGFALVRAAVAAGQRVHAVPGPSAVLTALAISGLPVDRFCFEGFLPRKPGERRRRLQGLAAEPRTMVFFEAPHRLAEFLTDAADALGVDRRAAVCRELTKPYEQVVRGPLAELADWASEPPRGEVTVVIQGAPQATDDWESALDRVRVRVNGGARLSEAVAEVARETGLRRKGLYERALAARAAGEGPK